MTTFNVNTTKDWSAVVTSYPPDGPPVVLFRKERTPPFATVTAPDLTSALAIARMRYGPNVVVSQPGIVQNATRAA